MERTGQYAGVAGRSGACWDGTYQKSRAAARRGRLRRRNAFRLPVKCKPTRAPQQAFGTIRGGCEKAATTAEQACSRAARRLTVYLRPWAEAPTRKRYSDIAWLQCSHAI